MWRRTLVFAFVLAGALGLSACVGSTKPATNVRATEARLHASGYTNDGPAVWWWEYDTVRSDLGTANDTEVCGNPHEADRRCGPASAGSQANQVPIDVRATGLTPNTTYYFRFCGQDTNDSGPACASILSFRTTAGDFAVDVIDRGSSEALRFDAAPGTRSRLVLSSADSSGAVAYRVEDLVSGDRILGTSLVPGPGCQSIAKRPVDDAVICSHPDVIDIFEAGLDDPATDLANARKLDNSARLEPGLTLRTHISGGYGSDDLRGAEGGDVLWGGGGVDFFQSFGGRDVIDAQDGEQDGGFSCGEGDDILVANPVGEQDRAPYDGSCELIDDP